MLRGASEKLLWHLAPKFDQCLRESRTTTPQVCSQEVSMSPLLLILILILLFGGGGGYYA
jgi:hypothetical protein